MQRKTQLDALAVGLLVACSLVWGAQQVMAKATVVEIAPIFQAALRLAGAALLLWLWCLARRIPLFGRDGSWWPGLLVGLLFTAEFAFAFGAFYYTSASRVTLFLYTAPFWVALLLPWVLRIERLRPPQWLGLLLAFLAVMFVLRDGAVNAAHPQQWRGDLMALAGGLAWGLTTLVLRGAPSLARVSAEKLLFYQLAVGAVTLPPLSLLLGETWNWHWSGFAMASIGLQAAVGAFASYLAWLWLLGRYPATRISVFVFLTPVFALLFGSLWLGEAVTVQLLLGVALVAVGIVLVNRRPAG